MPYSKPNPARVLAFDVGGSHVSAGLCDLTTLQVDSFASAPLSSVSTPAEFVDLLYRLATQVVENPLDLAGAALAVPGPFDFIAGISYMRHKLKFLYGVSLRDALAERFGWSPTRFRFLNDAGAFLLGEVSAGAARGAVRAVGITLGTGIGSAFALNGQWVTEGKGVPPGGEIWNLPYGSGTVEDLLSTRALKRDYAARTGKNEDVAAIAAAGTDPEANAVFESFGAHLGQVFRSILAPFAPEVVVIGGGISRSAYLFLPAAQKEIRGFGFRLVTSSLLDKAPLAGATVFWQNGVEVALNLAHHEHDGD